MGLNSAQQPLCETQCVEKCCMECRPCAGKSPDPSGYKGLASYRTRHGLANELTAPRARASSQTITREKQSILTFNVMLMSGGHPTSNKRQQEVYVADCRYNVSTLTTAVNHKCAPNRCHSLMLSEIVPTLLPQQHFVRITTPSAI